MRTVVNIRKSRKIGFSLTFTSHHNLEFSRKWSCNSNEIKALFDFVVSLDPNLIWIWKKQVLDFSHLDWAEQESIWQHNLFMCTARDFFYSLYWDLEIQERWNIADVGSIKSRRHSSTWAAVLYDATDNEFCMRQEFVDLNSSIVQWHRQRSLHVIVCMCNLVLTWAAVLYDATDFEFRVRSCLCVVSFDLSSIIVQWYR